MADLDTWIEQAKASLVAPLAAGVLALLKAAHPNWTPADLVSLLRTSAIAVAGLPVPQVSAVAALAPAPVKATPIVAGGVNLSSAP